MTSAENTDRLPAEGPARYVRADLRQLPPYTLDQTPYQHKLDQNEVPWDLPSRLKRDATSRLLARNWAIYPDFHADRLRQALGELHGHDPAGVLVGNGSNELFAARVVGHHDSGHYRARGAAELRSLRRLCPTSRW